MLSKIAIAIAFVGIATANPPKIRCEPVATCIDGINSCGVAWEGYKGQTPTCDGYEPTPVVTSPPEHTTYPPEYPTEYPTENSSDCSSLTICADYVNECGLMYGGCFPDCSPWPTFTPPPCPTDTSTLRTHTAKPTKRPECSDGGEHKICVDKVNDCGMKYGGCYDYCATPTPSFVTPACPSSTKTTITSNPSRTRTRTRRTKTTPQPTPSRCEPPSIEEQCEEEGSLFLCVDGIDECGNGWGDCYDVCATPTLSRPTTPCSTTPQPTIAYPEPMSTSCADVTLCIDYVNECGMWYGGCHNVCSTPSYSKPPCPSTSTATPTGSDPSHGYEGGY